VHQVGGIKPGCFKIGNTGGMMDNIIASKLYRPGSVGYVSKSGGTPGWRLSTGARTVAEAHARDLSCEAWQQACRTS